MFINPNILLLLPIIFPLTVTIILLTVRKKVVLQHTIQLIGGAFHLIASGFIVYETWKNDILITQLGGWEAPFGITFIADKYSSIVLFISSIISFLTAAYSVKGIDRALIKTHFYPLYYIMLTGISGILLTGDIFNFYVWIEVMLISSFALLALGGHKSQIEGTINYLTLNLLGSFLLLIGIGFLYGVAGTLNMAQLGQILPNFPNQNLLVLIASFFIVGLGIKTAIFPLYFWLPASYPTPPAPIAAIFGGLLAKVGFYSLLRFFTLFFPSLQTDFKAVILIMAAFTMLTAVLAAVAHHDLLKILSVHVVSQIGYLVLGLGLFSLASYAGAIFFLIHIIAVKTNLFLIAGLTSRLENDYNVNRLGGGIKKHPFLAALFLVNALSLAGVPPLSGFWGKFFLIKAAIDDDFYIMAGVGLITGVFTLISMTKIWNEVFWKKKLKENREKSIPLRINEIWTYYAPIVAITVIVLAFSLAPGFFYQLSHAAAEQIYTSSNYINAVLNK